MDIYNFINNLDQKQIFLFASIFVFTLWIFKNISIKLSVVVGLVIWIGIIIYLNQKKEQDTGDKNNEHNIKLQTIKPKPKNFSKYDNVIDFFFSIQDLYVYNPQAYEEMIDNTDEFLSMYEEIEINPIRSNELFNPMFQRRRNALNALQSLIYKVPSDPNMINKLNDSMKELDDILYIFLDKVNYLHNKHLYENGYTSDHKLIDNGPLAYNNYDTKSKFAYEFY